MARETGLSFADIQALSEYPNPEVFYEAAIDRKRVDRLDYMLDTALSVRAASATASGFTAWIAGLRAERRRSYDKEEKTVFDRLKSAGTDTVFSRLKRGKNGWT